jgi:hypothetical protein
MGSLLALLCNIIVDPVGNYERFKNTVGMLQRAAEREGVDLSELL